MLSGRLAPLPVRVLLGLLILLAMALPLQAQDDRSEEQQPDKDQDGPSELDDEDFANDSLGDDDAFYEEEDLELELDEQDLGVGQGRGAKRISIGLLLGYGTKLSSSAGVDINPFGVGFGARGGYNLDAIYLGGRFVFFLGESTDRLGGEESFNEFTLGVVAGYDMRVSGLLLRPEASLGLAISSHESVTAPTTAGVLPSAMDESSEDFYFAPGATALYELGDDLSVGAELQLPIIMADKTVLGLTIMATGSMVY